MFASLKKWLNREPDLDDGLVGNDTVKSRNTTITLIVIVLLVSAFFAFKYFGQRQTPATTSVEAPPPNDFGEIITDDFTEEDNRSALKQQGQDIEDVQVATAQLKKEFKRLQTQNQQTLEQLRKKNDELHAELLKVRDKQRQSTSETPPSNEGADTHKQDDIQTFGARPLPPRPIPSYSNDDMQQSDFEYQPSETVSFDQSGNGFDSFQFEWHTPVPAPTRTPQNYVPSGTFVTARITGGADANAGAFGQSDTAPIVFQTVHDGVLPNGKHSYLNNCTIIGSVYGELSSSRGIARTNTLSCVRDDDIIDIPVQGTVFNFGRNGIRGTSILRNGEIIQMAGVAGILTGLGDTGAGLASTTSTSALGATSTVNPEDIGLSLLGNATSEVGSKLSDYYIALAELYNPYIEINPGGLVNIVFTQGFPIDEDGIKRYERAIAEDEKESHSASNVLLNTITQNPLATELNQAMNP